MRELLALLIALLFLAACAHAIRVEPKLTHWLAGQGYMWHPTDAGFAVVELAPGGLSQATKDLCPQKTVCTFERVGTLYTLEPLKD